MQEISWLAEVTVASKGLLCFVEVAYLVVSPPPMALQPNAGQGLRILDEVSRSHTTMRHSR